LLRDYGVLRARGGIVYQQSSWEFWDITIFRRCETAKKKAGACLHFSAKRWGKVRKLLQFRYTFILNKTTQIAERIGNPKRDSFLQQLFRNKWM